MNNASENDALPVWGGLECSINRVGEDFFDQLDFSNYYTNKDHLMAVIRLGIKTLRFPLLWEKHQPFSDQQIDWAWAEEQLGILQTHQVTPVIGLLHHGSGPVFTNLLDENFPEQFAGYARQVAIKFPWLNFYNPINEPLTTARFSGLYGLWYPHKKNDVSFIRILLNELKGIVLAMQEIRKINPAAQLVQTEDLGKTYSTTLLNYQANFENHRRWLTYDILTGRCNETHPLWNYFMRLGIEKEKLQFFIDHPCSPDIIGVNHYVTSERFLDEKTENYPVHTIGGNGIHQYADVEAIRVNVSEPHGLKVLLKEIWKRYQIPVAITEVHLHCSREEQIRWLREVYDIAVDLKKTGTNICAVTAWALLGSFGWDKLLTTPPGTYETGAFDISKGNARPTAIAKMIKDLTCQKDSLSQLTQLPGWWNSKQRFFKKVRNKNILEKNNAVQPILIIGKTGTLGQAYARICTERNLPFYLVGREEADIANSALLEASIQHYNPWAIINAAGFVDIDRAETEKINCYRENNLGVQKLGIICERLQIKLVCFSSDQVFNGKSNRPYKESDLTDPLNIYGHSKQLAEIFLQNVNPSALIIRTSAFFGPWDRFNFLAKMRTTLSAGHLFSADDDITVSPTYIPHLVHASLDLLIDDAAGIWHLTNKGSVTWYKWAEAVAIQSGLDSKLIIPVFDHLYKAKRPLQSSLTSERYGLMPSLDSVVVQYLQLTNSTLLTHVK